MHPSFPVRTCPNQVSPLPAYSIITTFILAWKQDLEKLQLADAAACFLCSSSQRTPIYAPGTLLSGAGAGFSEALM